MLARLWESSMVSLKVHPARHPAAAEFCNKSNVGWFYRMRRGDFVAREEWGCEIIYFFIKVHPERQPATHLRAILCVCNCCVYSRQDENFLLISSARKGHFSLSEGENWVFLSSFLLLLLVLSLSSLLIRCADGIKTNNFRCVFHAGLASILRRLLIMIYAHIFHSKEFHSFFFLIVVCRILSAHWKSLDCSLSSWQSVSSLEFSIVFLVFPSESWVIRSSREINCHVIFLFTINFFFTFVHFLLTPIRHDKGTGCVWRGRGKVSENSWGFVWK